MGKKMAVGRVRKEFIYLCLGRGVYVCANVWYVVLCSYVVVSGVWWGIEDKSDYSVFKSGRVSVSSVGPGGMGVG